MIIVKVKSKKHTFIIPVPYAILRMGTGILTSNYIQRKIMHRLKKHDGQMDGHSSRKHDSDLDLILENRNTKQAIRQLIKELQRCKGTVLVEVQAQDGTEVLIKL